MNKFLLTAFLAGTLFTAGAIEPGGALRIGELQSKSVSVIPAELPKASYEIMMFFDASARDAASYLRMLEDLHNRMAEFPEAERANVFALARNTARAVKDAIGPDGVHFPVGSDEKQYLFGEYAAGELLLPFALIGRDGKIIWKGSPLDLESVMNLIRANKFEPSRQIKIERIRKEMQMAVQASLPDVILRCADEILKLQSGDTLAIQAKLFVYESSDRFSAALSFTKRNALENPADVNQTLLYLDYLRRAGDPAPFPSAFRDAVKQFEKSPESLFRILAFAAGGSVPFSWLPAKDIAALPDAIRTAWKKQPSDRRARFSEYEARIRYGLCDAAGAVRAQQEACSLAGERTAGEFRRMLDFYRSVQSLSAK